MADNQGLKPIYIEQLFRSKNPGVAKNDSPGLFIPI